MLGTHAPKGAGEQAKTDGLYLLRARLTLNRWADSCIYTQRFSVSLERIQHWHEIAVRADNQRTIHSARIRVFEDLQDGPGIGFLFPDAFLMSFHTRCGVARFCENRKHAHQHLTAPDARGTPCSAERQHVAQDP